MQLLHDEQQEYDSMRPPSHTIPHAEKYVGSPSRVSSSAADASLKGQLATHIYRIYANVSRQREWFIIHEQNVRAIAEEAEALRQRFFPEEESLLLSSEDNISRENTNHIDDHNNNNNNSNNNRDMTTNSQPVTWLSDVGETDGAYLDCREAVSRHNPEDPNDSHSLMKPHFPDDHSIHSALERTVPAYLLQLTPSWVQERLSANTEEVEAARAALLLPLLQSLGGIVAIAYHVIYDESHHTHKENWSDRKKTDALTLRGIARHLFYILHETLCCFSLQTTRVPVADSGEVAPLVAQLLQAPIHEALLRLLCQGDAEWRDSQSAAAVPPHVAAEALNYLALVCMGGHSEGTSVLVT